MAALLQFCTESWVPKSSGDEAGKWAKKNWNARLEAARKKVSQSPRTPQHSLSTEFNSEDDPAVMPPLKAMAQDAKSKKKPSASKKESKTAPEPAYKSAEFIQDSDDEEDNESEEDSESEDEPLPANPVEAIPRSNGKTVVAEESSGSNGSESSSSSGGESDSNAEEDSSSDDDEEETTDSGKAPAVVLEPAK